MKLTVPPWAPITPARTCGSLCRSPEHLLVVVDQFSVDISPRYRPGAQASYCNIFATDVTKALACEVPHWWMGRELSANEQADWLRAQGRDHGWFPALETEARAAAAAGRPALVTYRALKGHGHIAVVLPSDTPGVTEIAQAGATNFTRAPLAQGFGGRTLGFWTHD